MIRVANFFDVVPEDLQREQKRLEKDLLEHKKTNNSCWTKVKPLLVKIFNGKCAYCEAKLENPESIDHYRPKAQNKYFWLAHEWTNFLPACRLCQNVKANKFETQNEPQLKPPTDTNGNLDYMQCRADSAYLLSEEALLLHPVLDNPEEHFDLDLDKKGKIIPLTPKGERTEVICNLNRTNLILDRSKIIREKLHKLTANKKAYLSQGFDEDESVFLAKGILLFDISKVLENESEAYHLVYLKLMDLLKN